MADGVVDDAVDAVDVDGTAGGTDNEADDPGVILDTLDLALDLVLDFEFPFLLLELFLFLLLLFLLDIFGAKGPPNTAGETGNGVGFTDGFGSIGVNGLSLSATLIAWS